ncbi:hypothetical protein CcI156_20775 [Frankia sp. CcI156]|uniref:Uncharacterized protein n=1 Tax=Frankia casuarinae (strain DSM 45818 / CECT 9043 / HFP020203 / CcI3) TaxID=106370 RepID=Q2J5K0_FRACC|nr:MULTISPECIES: hypothetical protein [Frankia]ABD13442.1 hypothetical protein Francci3_4094 [Frankia casuarinae]ETA00256.1 hypothetical protein CcI6DRAFT_04319 [Frankia sp. CcI6]EYT90533.1 hypothetical protein ThrDRAFT_03837 [Frankia casuarinae]KDA40434.1 hypothetical protein BMG523Draft_04763 [Frankia sp. BMG5.23]KFB02932.1 hypothetical protein ALLO2DRAFT_04321 [Frankia sp. Allo2]
MSSIPPSGRGGWRNPYEGRPFVTINPHDDHGLYDLAMTPGASLRDLVDVTATLPPVLFIDHWRVSPGDSAVILRFRTLPDLGSLLGGL